MEVLWLRSGFFRLFQWVSSHLPPPAQGASGWSRPTKQWQPVLRRPLALSLSPRFCPSVALKQVLLRYYNPFPRLWWVLLRPNTGLAASRKPLCFRHERPTRPRTRSTRVTPPCPSSPCLATAIPRAVLSSVHRTVAFLHVCTCSRLEDLSFAPSFYEYTSPRVSSRSERLAEGEKLTNHRAGRGHGGRSGSSC